MVEDAPLKNNVDFLLNSNIIRDSISLACARWWCISQCVIMGKK